MGIRCGPEDFGYTFVRTEEEPPDEQNADVGGGGGGVEEGGEGASHATAAAPDSEGGLGVEVPAEGVDSKPAASAAVAAGDDDAGGTSKKKKEQDETDEEKKKPYVYVPPKRHGGGGGYPSSSQDPDILNGDDHPTPVALLGSLGGACCCCVTATLVVVGGVLIAYDSYSGGGSGSTSDGSGGSSGGSSSLVLAGSIVLILAAASFILGCCACCFGFAASCSAPGSGSMFGSGSGGGEWEDHRETEVRVQLRRLNDRYEKAEDVLNAVHLDVVGGMKEIREAQKKEAKARKEEEKAKKEELEKHVKDDLESGLSVRNIRRNYRPIAFLIRFDGDMMLSNMELLRKQISIVVNCGRAGVDQAVVVVTSPGGSVSPYGLAASQLVRVRKAGIRLVVCVDTVAASGGYMMASVGDQICAAPFAVIGSIGVVTQIPNFQRFLNKHSVDAFLFTAGKHKRTVDIIGDVTEEGKAKLQEELDGMHAAFKDHVALARPRLRETIEDVATGEYWLAVHARERGLVDEIMTSDEYLESICRENEIIEIVERKRRTVWSSLHAAARGFKAVAEELSVQHHQGPTPMAVT